MISPFQKFLLPKETIDKSQRKIKKLQAMSQVFQGKQARSLMALSVLQTHTKHYLKHKLEISVTEHQFRAAKEPLDQDLIMQVQFHQRWLRQLTKRLQWPTDKANQKNKCTENSQTILHPNNWDVVTLQVKLKTCLWKVFQVSKINQKVKAL